MHPIISISLQHGYYSSLSLIVINDEVVKTIPLSDNVLLFIFTTVDLLSIVLC